jgi:hypothetical protein
MQQLRMEVEIRKKDVEIHKLEIDVENSKKEAVIQN